jgi:gliding motility-associated-like protein
VDYKWQYGDGATSANYYGEHTYTKAGTNTVQLIANDASIKCADTVIQVINVKDFNTAFTFSTSYITGSSCPPALVRINNLSVGATRVEWDFGDGTKSNDQFYPSHTYTKPGTYKITLYTYGYNGLTGTYRDSVVIKQPSAKIAADVLQGCTSQKVTLKAEALNTDSYFWDFGDGTIINGTTTSAIHQYKTAGIYQPRLILKDATGCSSSTQLADKIIIDSLHIAIKGIPTLICDSSEIFFTPQVTSIAAQGGYPLTYHWDFGTGVAKDTLDERNAVFNYNQPGNYNVRFKVTSPFGCVQEVSEKVVVNKKAKASISGAQAICEGGTASFNGNASMSPVTWAWTFNNGNAATVQNPGAQSYQVPGSYDVRLIVAHKGCLDTAIHKLTVHPNPSITLNASKKLICLGETTLLTATGGTSYAWTPAATLNNPAVAAPTASPSKNTIYTVNVTNQFGCVKKDSIAIVVAQPFKIATAKDVSVCSGSSAQLHVKGATSYQWINYTTGLSNTTIANPVAKAAVSSTYTVVGSDPYNCFKDTAVINLTVHPLPTVDAEPDFEMLAAETHQLKATASADVVQWQWSPETYLNCSNCASPAVTPRVPMEYTVTVKNRFGCEASDNVSVSLQCSENFIYIPNSFTPNNDGRNDLFYIKGKGIGVIKSLAIYNRWGEVIFERKNFDIDDVSSAWNGTYKGLPAPAGAYVYFAEMQCNGGRPIIKKGTVVLIR